MDDRICASCHGQVSAIDIACRHCGNSFNSAIKPRGSFLNDFFRIALGLWALALPGYCLWLALRYEDTWGEFMAYAASYVYFVPWLVGVISLAVMVWLSQERR